MEQERINAEIDRVRSQLEINRLRDALNQSSHKISASSYSKSVFPDLTKRTTPFQTSNGDITERIENDTSWIPSWIGNYLSINRTPHIESLILKV